MNPIYLSVVIPAYKEGARIGATLRNLGRYFKDKTYGYEIIVVNDGSPDDTADVVRRYQKDFPALRLIDLKKNRGKGHAVKSGMREARGQYRLFMDADNSVKIDEIERFIRVMEEEKRDVAIGSIAFGYSDATEHAGAHRRFLGSLSKFFVRIIAIQGIYDTQRGFKVFTSRAADIIFPKQRIDRFGFDIELLVIADLHGMSIAELPVVWDNPAGSTVHPSDYAKTLSELFIIFGNKLRGAYYPDKLSGLKKATLITAFIAEVPFLFARFFFELTASRIHLLIKQFDKETRGKKIHGIVYRGQEFVHWSDLNHSETALYSLVRGQKFFLICSGFLFLIALIVNWHVTLIVLIAAITILYFIDLMFNMYLILRSFNRSPEIQVSAEEVDALRDEGLPIYTVFCPLYKEWQVAPQFVAAMNALDYPKNKLQVLFLLEENDAETIEKIRSQTLPSNFEIVIVPHSKPKTKPKAMNYGLSYARGKYLVIYDAEDMPEPDQLKKAIAAFSKSAENTVCIQAKLNFYNISQNMLTRIFTAEYSLWFDLVLPGLQSIGAPIPLGGTSNHFDTEALRELHGWDAFNVTEDCDLGMRLAKRGMRTAIVESTTYEEANSDMANWFHQRSRWIKGYMQTYIVHMRDPKAFKKGWKDMLAFQVTVGGKIFSILVNPLFWLITICYFAFRAHVGVFIESFFPTPILYIGVVSFILGNFVYLYNYMIGCAKRRFDHLIKYVFLVPFYWFGMSLSAWLAAYEIVVRPHYWSKTVHGLHLANRSSSP
jgi:cellulose synthase/poly-beta-1,6-N-acetylglucosamine synthase-like glycosyltransferase